MSQDRRNKILKAIIEIFIDTANPVGSASLKKKAQFDVSPATLRSEMAKLEQEGFLKQSHSSSGRIPTSSGYRFFVEDLTIDSQYKKGIQTEFIKNSSQYFSEKKADETVHDILSVLSRMTPNIVFSTVPSQKKTFFLGISQILMLPEFSGAAEQTSGIFRILEENFYEFLHTLKIGEEIEIFIGKENIFPEMESCSLLVTRFESLGEPQFLGILGPMRMNYEKNIISLQEAKKLYSTLS